MAYIYISVSVGGRLGAKLAGEHDLLAADDVDHVPDANAVSHRHAKLAHIQPPVTVRWIYSISTDGMQHKYYLVCVLDIENLYHI